MAVSLKDRKADRHRSRFHTQVRDIPPEVWARIKAAAAARYVIEGHRARPLNIGEYITRCATFVEQVRDIAEMADSEDEFYKRVTQALEELGLETVRA